MLLVCPTLPFRLLKWPEIRGENHWRASDNQSKKNSVSYKVGSTSSNCIAKTQWLNLQFQCFQKFTFKFSENYNGFEEQQLCGRTFLANDGMTIELTTPRPLWINGTKIACFCSSDYLEEQIRCSVQVSTLPLNRLLSKLSQYYLPVSIPWEK